MPSPTAQSRSSSRTKNKRPNGSGSYYPHPNNKFRASIKDIHGKLQTKVCASEIAAQEWLMDQRKMRENGSASHALRPKDTVSEFLTRYLDSRADIRHGTLKSYRGSVVRLTPMIGNLNAASLSPRAIETAYADLKRKGYKPGTIKAAHRLLSVAYGDAVRFNELPVNPMAKVKLPSGKSTATKLIPREDVVKLYCAAKSNPSALARLDVGLTLGLRPGEVYGLQWSDVDFVDGTITIERQVQEITGKGLAFQAVKQDVIRNLPLTSAQVEILMKHKIHQDSQRSKWVEDEELVFPNSVGKKMDARRDRRWFADLCRTTGVKRYQVYQMRKTCFTNMATSGTDLRTLMDFSGHTNAKVVIDSYLSSTSDSLRQATARLDALRPEY